MSKDYYRPVIAIRAVNYINGDGKTHYHTIQFRREHSDHWVEIPVLNMPYGSEEPADVDMAGYDWESESVEDDFEEVSGDDDQLIEQIHHLQRVLEVSVRENDRLTNKVKQLDFEIKGWKELFHLKAKDH
jgi:hypothetical protein